MTLPQRRLQPAHPYTGIRVLHARTLRAGATLAATARFDDEVWQLGPAILQQHQSALRLRFTSVPDRYMLVAKELCYGLLSGDLPAGEFRPALSTIECTCRELTRFFNWLATHVPVSGGPAGPMLRDLTAADLISYHRHLTATCAPGRRIKGRAAVRQLWRFRTALTGDQLPFDPRHIDGWSEPRPGHSRENATDRIPEQVHGPLLAWAMRFVDDFAPDILAADAHWNTMRTTTKRCATAYGATRQAIRQTLDDHIARRRPLPGRQGKVNLAFLAAVIGCNRGSLGYAEADIAAAVADVGISTHTCLDIPITGLLDGQPWLDAIATEHSRDDSRANLTRMLQAACYIVIAFLSGMRDSEKRAELRLMQHSDCCNI